MAVCKEIILLLLLSTTAISNAQSTCASSNQTCSNIPCPSQNSTCSLTNISTSKPCRTTTMAWISLPSGSELPCQPIAPLSFLCELDATAQPGNYLTWDNPLLFAVPPWMDPSSSSSRLYFTAREGAAGVSGVKLWSQSTELAAAQVRVEEGGKTPGFVMPYRAACIDPSAPCSCPPLGSFERAWGVYKVACLAPCTFGNVSEFEGVRGTYRRSGGEYEGVAYWEQEGGGMRIFYVGQEQRWYIATSLDSSSATFRSSISPVISFKIEAFEWEELSASGWIKSFLKVMLEYEILPACFQFMGPSNLSHGDCTEKLESVLLKEQLIGSATVYLSHGETVIDRFLSGVSPLKDYVQAGTTFLVADHDGATFQLENVTEDREIIDTKLTFASAIETYNNETFWFAAEFSTDSIVSYTHSPTRFIDRFRHDEERIRLGSYWLNGPSSCIQDRGKAAEEKDFYLSSVCDVLPVLEANSSNTTFIALTGCEQMSMYVNFLNDPYALLLDRPSSSQCVDPSSALACNQLRSAPPGLLWNLTTSWWEFSLLSLLPAQTNQSWEPNVFADVRDWSNGKQFVRKAAFDLFALDPVSPSFISESANLLNAMMSFGELQVATFDNARHFGFATKLDASSLAEQGLLPMSKFSVETWITINTDDIPFAGICSCTAQGPPASGWTLSYSVQADPSGSPQVSFFFEIALQSHATPVKLIFDCPTSLCKLEEWMHVVAVFNTTSLTLFVNGQKQAERDCKAEGCGTNVLLRYPSPADPSVPFLIGSFFDSSSRRFFSHTGSMRKLRLFSSSLTAAQVSSCFLELTAPASSSSVVNISAHPVPSSSYWTRLNSSSSPSSSPSVLSGPVEGGTEIVVVGSFLFTRTTTFRCRFSLLFSTKDRTIAYSQATPVTPDSLRCSSPLWHHGYKSAFLSVEFRNDDLSPWKPIWQRSCFWKECGFDLQQYLTQTDSTSTQGYNAGLPAKFVFQTHSYIISKISESNFKRVALPVDLPYTSALEIARDSFSYLFVAVADNNLGGAVDTHSVVYRISPAPDGAQAEVVKRVPSTNARQWSSCTFTEGNARSEIVALASFGGSVKFFMMNETQDGLELNELHEMVFAQEAISGIQMFNLQGRCLLAISVFYNFATLSTDVESRLFELKMSRSGDRISLSSALLQSFSTSSSNKVTHFVLSDVVDRHFLTFSEDSKSATLYEWSNTLQIFDMFQQLDGFPVSEIKLFNLLSVPFLAAAMHKDCSSSLSGLSGKCSKLYRWNGNRFQDLANMNDTLKETSGGQELPAANKIVQVSKRVGEELVVLFDLQTERTPSSSALEEGTRTNLSQWSEIRLFLPQEQRVSCLAAPVALVMQEGNGVETSRLVVLSYHYSSLSVFDVCNETGIIKPSATTQCTSAFGAGAGAGAGAGEERGAVQMTMSGEGEGCRGKDERSRCLYVLDTRRASNGSYEEHQSFGAVHILSLSIVDGSVEYIGAFFPSTIAGPSKMMLTTDSKFMLLFSSISNSIAVLQRNSSTGEFGELGLVQQGEKMLWEYDNHIASRGLSWVTAADVATGYLDTSFNLLSPSRIFGSIVASSFASELLLLGVDRFLLVAQGEAGVAVLRWNADQETFVFLQHLNKDGVKDANAVHLTITEADGEKIVIVSNWVNNNNNNNNTSAVNVYKWNISTHSFDHIQSLGELSFFSRSSSSLLADGRLFLAVAFSCTSHLLPSSLVYRWEAGSGFVLHQQISSLRALSVAHVATVQNNLSRHFLVIAGDGGDSDISVECANTECTSFISLAWSTHVEIWEWNDQQKVFRQYQNISLPGVININAFSLPCRENYLSKDTTVCEEQYIVLSRINEPVTAASDIISLLAASDAQPTIFAFHSLDADANVVELSNSLTDAGSSPILPLLACDDSDRYQEDPRLIWGGCATYLPGGSNQGFCASDAVCSICSFSCAHECSDNAACDFLRSMAAEESQLYIKRYLESLKFMWPQHDTVKGLRGCADVYHFEDDGEHYFAVAQGIRALVSSSQAVFDKQVMQPYSAVLQWTGRNVSDVMANKTLIDEISAVAPNKRKLPGLFDLPARTFALRFPTGVTSKWTFVSLPDRFGNNNKLLIANSITEGLMSFPWNFKRTEGLQDVSMMWHNMTSSHFHAVDMVQGTIKTFDIVDDQTALSGVFDQADRLFSRVLQKNISRFCPGILEGAKFVEAKRDKLAVYRGLPRSRLMCSYPNLSQDWFEWQERDYGTSCFLPNFTVVEAHYQLSMLTSGGEQAMQLDARGTLTVRPNVDMVGSRLYRIVMNQWRNTRDGAIGCNLPSLEFSRVFALTTSFINHAPTFDALSQLVITTDSHEQNITFAWNVSSGDENLNQTLRFLVSFSTRSSFSQPPKIWIYNKTGIMTLHLNNTKYETVDVTLQLIDGGGVFRLNGNTYGQDRTAVKNLKMILKTLTTGVFARISCPSVTILEGNGTISRDCAVQVEVDGESLQSGFNFSLESARQVPDFGLLPNQIFQTLPSLTTDGKLSFRAAHWIHGQVVLAFSVSVVSNGSLIVSSISDRVVIDIVSVNNPPSFILSSNVIDIKENDQDRSLTFDNFIANISAGAIDEDLLQLVSFQLSYATPDVCSSMLASMPQIYFSQPPWASRASLRVDVLAGGNGGCDLALVALDNGNSTPPGSNRSLPQLLTVRVLRVNDPPTFLSAPTVFVIENSGAQLRFDAITNISRGGVDEVSQNLTFRVQYTSETPALFQQDPHVFDNGTLTFWVNDDKVGNAVLSIVCFDDGGTEFGGSGVSTEHRVMLQVLARPRIFSVSPRLWGPNGLSTNRSLTINGVNFSPSVLYSSSLASWAWFTLKDTPMIEVFVGQTPCAQLVVVSDTQLVCEHLQINETDLPVKVRVSEIVAGVVREGNLSNQTVYSMQTIFAGVDELGSGFVGFSQINSRMAMMVLNLSLDKAVRAVSKIDDTVYLGGSFQQVSGTRANYIVDWTGDAFRSLGNGLDGSVRGLLPLAAGPQLLVYGSFTTAYQDPKLVSRADLFVRSVGAVLWDVRSRRWLPLFGTSAPSGRMASALSITGQSDGSFLALAGQFLSSNANPDETGGLALLQMSTMQWSPLCSGGFCGVQGGEILTMTAGTFDCMSCNFELVVGGNFASAGGERDTKSLASWDGTKWRSLGQLDGEVFALASMGRSLFVGGAFATVGGRPVNGVVRYSSGAWSPLGSGVRGIVYSLSRVADCLYVGGEIDAVGFLPRGSEVWTDPTQVKDQLGNPVQNVVEWCEQRDYYRAMTPVVSTIGVISSIAML